MSLTICPITTVNTPIDYVWELLTKPSGFDEWLDVHVERIEPEGPLSDGQTIHLWTRALGKRWKITFLIEKVDPEKHQVQMTILLPLGIKNHEHIVCTPLDATSCRLQFG